MARIEMLAREDMDPRQREVHDDIVAGPRGSVRGPFQAWLRSPELADRGQQLGEFCRFNTSLGPRLSELAILVTARHFTAQFEWYAHAPLAAKAGISDAVIEAIRTRGTPQFEKEDEAAVYAFASEYYAGHRVSTETYERVKALFGERGVADLVGVMGYYMLVSATLNVFEMETPDGDVLDP